MPTLLMTAQRKLLKWNTPRRVFGWGAKSTIVQCKYDPQYYNDFVQFDTDADSIINNRLSVVTHRISERKLNLSKADLFYSAEPNREAVTANREAAALWETFYPISAQEAEATTRFDTSIGGEVARFCARVTQLNSAGEPVKIYCGSGSDPRPGFLNLDIIACAPEYSIKCPDDYFIFPFADMSWGLPNGSVDYIFDEDFIEHISQIQQIQYLAETRRVLKDGCVHRVNTPNLIPAMKLNSDFPAGFSGVYQGELVHGHIALFSREGLEEMARLVGYSDVIFNGKSEGISPHAVPDMRPLGDRDDVEGNLYADLLK